MTTKGGFRDIPIRSGPAELFANYCVILYQNNKDLAISVICDPIKPSFIKRGSVIYDCRFYCRFKGARGTVFSMLKYRASLYNSNVTCDNRFIWGLSMDLFDDIKEYIITMAKHLSMDLDGNYSFTTCEVPSESFSRIPSAMIVTPNSKPVIVTFSN